MQFAGHRRLAPTVMAPKSKMISKWLHIDTSVGDPWILPVWGAVNSAETSGKVKNLSKGIRELGIHISTRLDILPYIIRRINSGVAEVYTAASNHKEEHVFSDSSEGYVLSIDKKLVYVLLADIDSILFELNSVCQLMTKLFEELYSHLGKPIKKGHTGLTIKNVIEGAGQDAGWFRELDSHRNFFIHNGAPYFAIDISRDSRHYDLLIMKENLKSFEDRSKFLKLTEINKIVQGFVAAKPLIQQHLIDLFSNLP